MRDGSAHAKSRDKVCTRVELASELVRSTVIMRGSAAGDWGDSRVLVYPPRGKWAKPLPTAHLVAGAVY